MTVNSDTHQMYTNIINISCFNHNVLYLSFIYYFHIYVVYIYK